MTTRTEQDAPEIHLSYHDGAHYNSVRAADDFADGPPAPVALGARSAGPAAPGAPPLMMCVLGASKSECTLRMHRAAAPAPCCAIR